MSIEEMMRPVTILHRSVTGETDDYGDETEGAEEIAALAAIQKQQRRGREEAGDAGEVGDTLWNGYFPIGTELRTNDAVRDEKGWVYELVGDPWEAKEGSEDMWHVEANMRRTAGARD